MSDELTVAITTLNHEVDMVMTDGSTETRCLDIVTVYRNGEEAGEVYVEASGDTESYDYALHRAGWRGWTWTTITHQ